MVYWRRTLWGVASCWDKPKHHNSSYCWFKVPSHSHFIPKCGRPSDVQKASRSQRRVSFLSWTTGRLGIGTFPESSLMVSLGFAGFRVRRGASKRNRGLHRSWRITKPEAEDWVGLEHSYGISQSGVYGDSFTSKCDDLPGIFHVFGGHTGMIMNLQWPGKMMKYVAITYT